MARIYRDAYGVPHVRATSVLDLARGQGWVTARDRAWQLEYQRRRATGTAGAALGGTHVFWDELARATRMVDTAQRAWAGLDSETQQFLAAYVEGVNAGLHADAPEFEAAGVAPEPWESWTPLAIFHAQHLLFAALPDKLWRWKAFGVLGPDARFLARDGALDPGSNAWAVGGARTASGLPLIGGDPHRTFESPGVYQQVRLCCEDPDDPFDVVGFTFPGVPGVQHFAHAGGVAWAITNACADYQDIYAEPRGDIVDLGVEAIARRNTAHEHHVNIATTSRGVVFQYPHDGRTEGLALRDVATVLGDLGFGALLPLLRARTVDDVDRALDAWVVPGNNVVIADGTGAVRFRNAGRIPVRPEANRAGVVSSTDPDGGWTGWVDLPRHDVPPDGHVVTANERRGPESEAIGTTFAPAHRANRLNQLLDGRDDLTPADFERLHNDTRHLGADAVVEFIATLAPGPSGTAVQEAVLAWDRHMDADSPGASAFAAWRNAFTTLLVQDPVFDGMRDSTEFGPVLSIYLDVTASVGLALETLIGAGSPFGIDLAAIGVRALEEAAEHAPTWGANHRYRPTHAFTNAAHDLIPPEVPEVPVSGDFDTVRCTGSLPGLTDDAYRGSVARYVWDLSDPNRGAWIVPMGSSGDPRSPHHLDQLDAWVEGRLVPIEMAWDALTLESSSH